ncbi:hypothetical protein HNR44_001627 [Geomicrobium halophilum]|uniref:Uncharacterized protein n=1 Tax=Geomicrobium halophilum TaxID=549000 RepID=A0A841PLL5_9BACL|nr:hypothetical protein [Geomicrobium halophilum]MBB6449649.1 hypothetical protein [Geomicrobium halophilum]
MSEKNSMKKIMNRRVIGDKSHNTIPNNIMTRLFNSIRQLHPFFLDIRTSESIQLKALPGDASAQAFKGSKIVFDISVGVPI